MGRKPPWREVTGGGAVLKGRPARRRESLYGCLDAPVMEAKRRAIRPHRRDVDGSVRQGKQPEGEAESKCPQLTSPFSAMQVDKLCSEKREGKEKDQRLNGRVTTHIIHVRSAPRCCCITL